MGLMPGHIAKGVILEKFDDFINSDRDHLTAALAAYKSGADIWKAIDWGRLPAQNILSQTEVNHIVNHWFPEHQTSIPPNAAGGSPFWNTMRPMGPVLRQGLITALTLCDQVDLTSGTLRTNALPIDSYWICTQSHFEVCVTLGHDVNNSTLARIDHHVNLLILTPNPPIPRHDQSTVYTGDEDIWVIEHSDIDPGATPLSLITDPVVKKRLKK